MMSLVRRRDPFELVFWLGGVFLVLGPFLLRLQLLRVRTFDADEFQHLHSAWLISEGYLPYRDYFQHHTPGLHYLLSPLFRLADVKTDPASAFWLIFLSRQLMWLFTGLGLGLTFCLGTVWKGASAGLVGTIMLGNCIMYLEKTIEIRPDVVAAALWTACILVLLVALYSPDQSAVSLNAKYMFSGALLALSLIFTQKMLVALPGLSITMISHLVDGYRREQLGLRIISWVNFAVGAAVPIATVACFFYFQGGLTALIEFCFLMNTDPTARWSPLYYLTQLTRQDPWLVAIGAVAVVWHILSLVRAGVSRSGDVLLTSNLVALVGALFVVPWPERQYYVTFLPLLALFAGAQIIELWRMLLEFMNGQITKGMEIELVITLIALFYALWFTLGVSKSMMGELLAYLVIWVLGAGVVWAALKFGWSHLALASLLVCISWTSLVQFRDAFQLSNTNQLDEIQYVLVNTDPKATVMDGWSGIGVFRPHAFFYWFLHRRLVATLEADVIDNLLAGLKSGYIQPALIIFDNDLRVASPDLNEFVTHNYISVGVGNIWRRR